MAVSMLWLAGLGLIWCVCSLGVFALGPAVVSEGAALLPAVMALAFVLLAARGSAVYGRRVEPCLGTRRGMRILLILACCTAAAAIFWLVRLGLLPPVPAFIFASANLLIFANLLGFWMISALKRPAELVPVCAVMAAADLLSLWGGPTREAVRQLEGYYRRGMEGPVPAVKFLLIQVPVPGQKQLTPLFGVADWIMVVFLLAAMSRFDFNDDLTSPFLKGSDHRVRQGFYLPVSAAGLLIAVLLAQGFGLFIPALPVVAMVFLAFLLLRFPSARRLQRIDWGVLLTAAALVLLAGVARLRLF